jgi:transposase
MNTKLHAVTDANGRPISFFMTAGQVSDYTGAAALLDDLPKARWLLGDRGYDADWFRNAWLEKGIEPCIPGRKSRLQPVRYDKRRYKRRNRIEIMFGRLKDWRRAATRYDRCPTVFFSAIALAATVIFWLSSVSPDPRRAAPALPSDHPSSAISRRNADAESDHRHHFSADLSTASVTNCQLGC